jgi:uncharacterized OsmC-like protein
MPEMRVDLSSIAGTEAALGWAAGHTVVVDRADGVAGGRGLGFNGGELLALSIGGCLCNDLRYAAHALGLDLGTISLAVTVEIDGTPPRVTGARVELACEGTDAKAVIARALDASIIVASVRQGFPVTVRTS